QGLRRFCVLVALVRPLGYTIHIQPIQGLTMAHDSIRTTQHPNYAETVTALETVRDCVQGSWKVKRERYKYLPHPSMIDTESKEQQARYAMYIQGAEFDNYPALSLRAWLGKMRIGNSAVDLPERLKYLEQNAD